MERGLWLFVKLRVRVRVNVKVKCQTSKLDPEVGVIMGWAFEWAYLVQVDALG